MDVESPQRDLFAGVNQARDPTNATDLERRHIPGIEAPGTVEQGKPFHVAVKVGAMLPHPSERHHFIEFIDFYADQTFLARVALTATGTRPAAMLTICLARPVRRLRAMARCNVHGIWVGQTPITVTE